MGTEIKEKTVKETLVERVSIRKYTEEDIADELLTQIIDTARRAPTSSNLQAYSIVVIRDKDKKKKLAELAGSQRHIETCPVFLLFCADITRESLACRMVDRTLAKNLENTLVATIDAALVGMTVSLVAESFGLGTVMIGGIRNHPVDVARVVNLPKGVYAVFGLCIGWPERIPPQKPRMQYDVIVHEESYSETTEDSLNEYDRLLAESYRKQGRETPDNAWTGIVGHKLSEPRRPKLKEQLEELGFSFD